MAAFPKTFLAFLAVLVAFAIQLDFGIELHEWSTRQPRVDVLENGNSEDETSSGALVQFSSRSETLVGRIFYPVNDTDQPPPVVILAHGLGLSQDCSLTGFVEAFRGAGFAAFTFDYATFGMSTGTPRHQVHPENHIMDIKAAISTLKERSAQLQIDASRTALFGTSLAGGHVLRVAAETRDNELRCIISQIPHLASGAESAFGTMLRAPGSTLLSVGKLGLAAVRWVVQWTMGRSLYVPLVGLPGSLSLMQNDGDFEGYLSLTPENGGKFDWRNATTLPSSIRILKYRPLDAVENVQTPVLMIAAEEDTLCPAIHVETARKLIDRRDTEVVMIKGARHFDLYRGEQHEQSVRACVAFLQKHMS